MIGNLYISNHNGLSIDILSINLREEGVLDAICYYFPFIDEYKKRPLTDDLTLYQIKVPKEKKLINCYFSTCGMETTVQEITYFETAVFYGVL